MCGDRGRLSGRGYRSVFAAAVLSNPHITHRNVPARRYAPSAASSAACLAHIGRGLRHFHSRDTSARSAIAGVPQWIETPTSRFRSSYMSRGMLRYAILARRCAVDPMKE